MCAIIDNNWCFYGLGLQSTKGRLLSHFRFFGSALTRTLANFSIMTEVAMYGIGLRVALMCMHSLLKSYAFLLSWIHVVLRFFMEKDKTKYMQYNINTGTYIFISYQEVIKL